MIPCHLWLPKAHVEAPTTGSVLLAGILLKLGSYGFIRFSLFLFPNASFYFLPLILSVAVISIILASFTVLRQTDLKRIIAYSSIAHMNFLVGAIFVKDLVALTGSLLLQIAHGLSSSALFLVIGMLYDRYKSRNIFYYRGLVTIMPLFCFFFFIFSLANLGFPSTVNFISEMLIFLGLFQTVPSIAILTLVGIFLSAAYSFVLLTRIAFGPASSHLTTYYDLTRREFYILLPFAFLIIFLGIVPNYLISYWTYGLVAWFNIQEIPLDFTDIDLIMEILKARSEGFHRIIQIDPLDIDLIIEILKARSEGLSRIQINYTDVNLILEILKARSEGLPRIS